MKTEAKVGAFTLAGLLLLAALVIGLSGFSLRSGKGYTVYAGFHQVVGLEKQAQVCLSGVPVGEVKSIVEGLRSDAKVQKNLEQALDERSGGVMKRLRAAFPKWKDEDFLLYLFTASGFSATTISTLLEKDKPYVYNRLYRLKERIKASSSPDSGDFLAYLEK